VHVKVEWRIEEDTVEKLTHLTTSFCPTPRPRPVPKSLKWDWHIYAQGPIEVFPSYLGIVDGVIARAEALTMLVSQLPEDR
jgi:hypothetical protein